ncbi:translation initiation factor IF-2 [Thermostichus vulcanus]|uniref:Translation initiation factor IF-2 n=1 Tax=Thermostichus vulcanus str. 'Rupite' TaxID=2813851 RepID=A0ABT0C8L4_THEVL|nr:translation initiation factor IF-2 [Thermostichus vulcanus]MCJ2542132.1 translation initiation factor IF-2 [Thermostichus vulcanus str. 'Rupite']
MTDKVRLYDIAREMGRENRDVLEVCEQLGIPFKSHSSTISLEQAEQVRSKLGKARIVQPPRSRSKGQPEGRPPESTPESRSGERPQQIVGIRRPVPAQRQTSVAEATPPSAPPAAKPSLQRPERASSAEKPEKKVSGGNTQLIGPPRRQSGSPVRPAEMAQEPEPTPPTPARPEPPIPVRPELPATKARSPEPSPAPVAKRPTVLTPPRRATSEPEPPVERPEPLQRAPESSRPSPSEASSPSRPRTPRPTEEGAPSRQPVQRPRPQLVGAPIRPGSRPQESPSPVAREDSPSGSSDTPRPQRRMELVGPPTRPAAKPTLPDLEDSPRLPEGIPGERPSPVLADAPVRPAVPKVKRKTAAEEEDEELQVLNRRTSRTQAKRKRSRRRGEGDGDTLDLDPTAIISAVKQAELNALKPLARPTAKPTSYRPPATVTVSSARPRPAARSQRQSAAAEANAADAPAEPEEKVLLLDGSLTVQELAHRLRLAETEIIKTLFFKGVMVTINQVLDESIAESVATELGYEIRRPEAESKAKKTEMLDVEDIDHLVPRPPVVTIMGHVDHGKTTLLDAIRDTNVARGEAGGITQRIGAYHVDVDFEGESRRVVFLDTPGHQAFTAMRARGTRVTDIAVLVVAADDGVQPQTLEAISHARAAQVPIIVAINKIDKPDSQPDRIKQQLAEHGLLPEEWGGDTPMVEVSALARLNLDSLLEMILLVADVAELQANPNRPARGTVVEAHLDKARGPVATLLVQNGTLRVGETLVAGAVLGRVKAMVDDRGNRLQEAGPSSAVQLLGLDEVPAAGDEFQVYPDEKEARRIAQERADALRQTRLQQALLSRRVSLGSISAKAQEGQLKELNLILKTDVQGSAEAIQAALQDLPQEEVQLRVLLAAAGEITETDVDLAAASEAIILGFNTSMAPGSRQAADEKGVDVREYDIIYNLLDDLRAAMEGLLDPEEVEEPLGQAEVRMVIPIGRGAIAGSYVLSGKVQRNALVRVRRKGEVIHEGRLDSLKRFKDDVREVASGFECGIGVDKFQAWQEGDIIEVYQMVSKRRTLTPA